MAVSSSTWPSWRRVGFAGGVTKPSWFDELDQDDPGWSFNSAVGATPTQLFAWFDESIDVSDRVIADALTGSDGLSSLSKEQDEGKRISLRWIVCHLSRSTPATMATLISFASR